MSNYLKSRYMKYMYIITIFILLSILFLPQTEVKGTTEDNIIFENYDDLFGGMVAEIFQDHYGYMWFATLNGLKDDEKWKSFSTLVYFRENFLDFDELKALMITKERNTGGPSTRNGSQESVQAFYFDNSRGRGHGFGRGRGGGTFGNQ